MLSKVCSVFTGFSRGEFEGEKGDKIEWCNAAFSVPGTADTFLLKVNLDEVDPGLLKPYKANYLMVDFRYDSKFKNWKGYIVGVFPNREEFDAASVDADIPVELFDESPAEASLRSMTPAKAAAVAAASK